MSTQLVRYQRNFATLTIEEQLKLASVTIAVVGVGGIGGYIAEEFARLGVGQLILIDEDRIEESNLNRQIMALEENLGELKVDVAKNRLQRVNSMVNVEIHPNKFNENNGRTLLRGTMCVFDALDNGETRLLLERICHELNLPLVFATIGGWFGLIGVSFPGDFSVKQIFDRDFIGIEKQLGNPAFIPALIASMSVAEGLKVILNRPVSLRKKVLYVDLLSMKFNKFELL